MLFLCFLHFFVPLLIDFFIHRYLVGLRWWTEHLTDGKEKWMFECRPDESLISKGDSRVFWSGQIIYVLGGAALIILSFFFGYWSMV